MFQASVTGNVGKPLEKKEANGKTSFCFTVAVSNKQMDGSYKPLWFFVSMSREPKEEIKKGAKVFVSGRVTANITDEKTMLVLFADEIAVMKNPEAQPQSMSGYTF